MRPVLWLVGFLLVIAMVGALLATWSVERAMERERRELLDLAQLAVDAQNVDRVKHMLSPQEDPNSPTIVRSRRQVELLGKGIPRCKDLHLVTVLPDGSVHRLEDRDSGGGDAFRGIPDGRFEHAVRQVQTTGTGAVLGPWRDDDGTWQLALGGIQESRSGKVVAVVAVRLDASGRTRSLFRYALPYGLATLILLVFPAVGFMDRSRSRERGWQLYLTAGVVLGLILTALVAWEIRRNEQMVTQDGFQRTALRRATEIIERIRIVRDNEMESLVRFISGRGDVSRRQFHEFSTFLQRNPMVNTWSWVARVDSSSRVRWEDSVRRAGLVPDGIWEQQGGGAKIQAQKRKFHLVVTYLAPEEGRESRLGFDILSDPIRSAAVQEAVATRLPVSSPPLRFKLDSLEASAMLFMRPVFQMGDSSRLKGFVVAAMEPMAPLRPVANELGVRYELLQLRSDSTPETLAATEGVLLEGKVRMEVVVPFLAFGKVFAVKIESDERGLPEAPPRMWATMLLLGGMSTLAMALLSGWLMRRRGELEFLVEERTHALRSTEQSYRDQFQENSSIMLMIEPKDRRIVDANAAACRFYGYSRERILELLVTDLDRTPEEEVGKSPDGDIVGRGKRHVFKHRLADGQIRDVEISSSFVQFGNGTVLHAIIHDVTERRRIEAERRLLEQRLEWALQATGDGVWDWNISTGTVKHNLRWCEILGLDETFLQHPIESFAERIHPNDRQAVLAKVESCLASGEPYSSEHRMLSIDGQVIQVLDRGQVVERDQDGAPLRMVGSMVDVTERKRAEIALRESEARLKMVMEIAKVAPWELDIAASTFHFGDEFYKLFGSSSDAEGGISMSVQEYMERFLPQEVRHVVTDEIARSFAAVEAGLVRLEHPARRVDGTEIVVAVNYRIVRGEDGAPIHLIGANQDITEQKRVEQELRASETRLKMVMGLSKIAPWECDLRKGQFEFNDQFYELFGTDAKAQGGYLMSIPDYLERFIPEATREETNEEMLRSLRNSSGDVLISMEHPARKADGTQIVIAANFLIERDADGKPIRTIGANQDITERKRAEEILRETNAILEEQTARANALAAEAEMANVAKSEFLANMSHEIRTPMNGVIGMTGLLLDTELTGEQRRFAEIVKQSSESLLALLNDILDFSKIEAGKLEMESLDFDLRTMFDDFAASLALRAEEKGLEFVCRLDPSVPRNLRGDPGRLRQVLTNLAGNAIKFTRHGEVFVRVSVLWDRGQEVELRFSVKDSGIGIPSDKISLLFNKFQQVDASTTRQFGGTGLGLAISKQLCEMMGGTIGIVSEEGNGSEFWFTARFVKQERQPEPVERIDLVQGARILVVDDNRSSREVVSAQIQAWGGRVETAMDGETAFQALWDAFDSGDPFRVAIVDLVMPGMDGNELIRRMRSDARAQATRIVIMTSMGRMRERRASEPGDRHSFLPKPVRQSDLFDVLAQELSGAETKTDRVEDPAPSSAREARTRPVRILLAEDNVVNQMVARGILERVGARVDVAGNGLEAIDALRSLPYDMVFLDVQMPEMDGLEASRRIRAGEAGDAASQLPLIAMTANAMQGDREICLAAGMDDYVSKPVTPKELVAMMDRWANRIDTEPVTTFFDTPEPVVDEVVELPVFDRETFFGRVLRNEALAKKVVASFLATIPGQIESLQNLVGSGDAKGAADVAHGIKGAAANVGAEALREVASRMEIAGKSGDLAILKECQPLLGSRYDALRKALETAF